MAMLAGGTGIAAMLQLMRAHVLYERKTGAEGCFDLPMIYACKNTDEILLREVRLVKGGVGGGCGCGVAEEEEMVEDVERGKRRRSEGAEEAVRGRGWALAM